MLIDPQGLLRGERVRACSDEAQLHFPRLLAASNSFGRFRMSVEWLQNEVYGSFANKPTKEQLTGWLREYHSHFLLFVYRGPDGSAWAQWEIPEKLLGKYRLTADRKTPAPPAQEHEAFRAAYAESIRQRNAANPDDLSEGFQNIPKTSGTFQKVPDHVGVGVIEGVGVGEGVRDFASPSAPPVSSKAAERAKSEPHPLHNDCRAAIFDYWKRYVIPTSPPTWDGSEGKALDSLLRALPSLTMSRFRAMLRNRGASDVNPAERPRKWIASLPDYELGPLDIYGKPRALRLPPISLPNPVVEDPDPEATARKEAEEKAFVRQYWRGLRDRGHPKYEHEAPAYIRRELEQESAQAVA